jgi:4-amino-4-deoxy-L-arabinose transferase-like glycosyltransferase
VVLVVAALDFLVHMLSAANYGYFRDELYYIVSGQHLQLGYVDFPPLIAYLAAILGFLAGDGLVAIHVVPALAGAALVFVAGMTARELGGGRLAQLLAASATAVTAQLAFASIFSMDILDALWWALASYVLIRAVRGEAPKLWLLFGLIAGIGMMTKLTIVFFLISVVVALLLTPGRFFLLTRWFWCGAAVAVLIVSPYIVWNAMNGWPTVDFYIHHGGLNGSGPFDFAALQVLILNPANIPLLILGFYFYLRSPAGRPYAVVGLASVLLFFLFLLINAKPYFYEGAFATILAGGAVAAEGWAGARGRRRLWLPAGLVLAITLGGVVLAPLEMPLLPPATFVGVFGGLTGVANGAASQENSGQLPQYLGDRFGWDTMTATVASVYHGLGAQERAQACIFASNYGEASALTFLGRSYGLPPVISGHNNFFVWGPGSCSGQVIIAVGLSQAELLRSFNNVAATGVITCGYCVSYENNVTIYLATNPKVSVAGLWPSVKQFG